MESEARVLARVAYAAYGATTDGLNYQGNEMPTFDALPVKIKAAWEAAVRAVLDADGGPDCG